MIVPLLASVHRTADAVETWGERRQPPLGCDRLGSGKAKISLHYRCEPPFWGGRRWRLVAGVDVEFHFQNLFPRLVRRRVEGIRGKQ